MRSPATALPGAAACSGKGGLYVNLPAAYPGVTSVGGTGFAIPGGLTFDGSGNVSGSGEIQVSFGGRLQNVRAYTRGLELSTGSAVRVIALHGDHALMVEKLS